MLKRLYVDNFRCLVNFELKLEPVTLLSGSNGSGKSSVFDILRRLQSFILGSERVYDMFPLVELTRWQTRKEQTFEIDLEIEEELFNYRLVLGLEPAGKHLRVLEEGISGHGQPLFSCQEGMVQLYRDDHSSGPCYPFDWNLSALGSLHQRSDNKRISRFKKELSRLIIVRPLPILMEQESRSEQERLAPMMENFVSWYRHLVLEQTEAMTTLFAELKAVMPGLESMSLKESGEVSRSLKVFFSNPGVGGRMVYDFSELSDGQKMLIALYTLAICLKGEGVSLFIDEPDNFVALREIQPWLTLVYDAVGDSLKQAVLVSHHPELIDYLGREHGKWFKREKQGPVRVESGDSFDMDELKLSEVVARGWDKDVIEPVTMCRQKSLRQPTPSSLMAACGEYSRFAEYFKKN